MTLMDAVAIEPLHTAEHSLVDGLSEIDGAVALVTSDAPGGVHAVCVVDERKVDFFDAEVQIMEVLLAARREYPQAALDLLCISINDASVMEREPESRIYRLA